MFSQMPLDGTEGLGLPVNRPMLEKATEVPHELLLCERTRKENNKSSILLQF